MILSISKGDRSLTIIKTSDEFIYMIKNKMNENLKQVKSLPSDWCNDISVKNFIEANAM